MGRPRGAGLEPSSETGPVPPMPRVVDEFEETTTARAEERERSTGTFSACMSFSRKQAKENGGQKLRMDW